MARRVTEPVDEEEIEDLQAEMREQKEEILEALAEDLGGDPDDYRAETYFAKAVSDE